MYHWLKIKSLLLISFLLLSCDNPLENRVNELEDELENQKIEQENQSLIISSLLNQLLTQQSIIDSLNKKQLEYADSINLELLQYTDSINSDQDEYIDSINIEQLKELDSLNMNLTNYIDELIQNQNQIIEMLITSQPSTSNDYLRIDSLQICWGNGSANIDGTTLTFPAEFTENPKVFMTPITVQSTVGVKNITSTSATFYTSSSPAKIAFSYNAFGKWK
jgi:hypothetical protein